MLTESKKYSFISEFISEYDPENIKVENISSLFSIEKTGNETFDRFANNLTLGQVSNALKHATAIQKASLSANISIILEDDVLYQDDIMPVIEDAIEKFSQDKSVTFSMLGMPSKVAVVQTSPISFIDSSQQHPILPACDSYIMKPETASVLAQQIFPIKFIYNIHLSWIMTKTKIPLHMTNRNIFVDGSKYGAFLCSLDTNSILPFNMDFITIYQTILSASPTLTETELIDRLNNCKFQNHPAMLHLRALFLIKYKKDYVGARKILDNAFDILKQNNCVLNGTSPIMSTYVGLFKHLQE
jgi:GR25 family glycosyltransferase involved in LPS biosynthesis